MAISINPHYQIKKKAARDLLPATFLNTHENVILSNSPYSILPP